MRNENKKIMVASVKFFVTLVLYFAVLLSIMFGVEDVILSDILMKLTIVSYIAVSVTILVKLIKDISYRPVSREISVEDVLLLPTINGEYPYLEDESDKVIFFTLATEEVAATIELDKEDEIEQEVGIDSGFDMNSGFFGRLNKELDDAFVDTYKGEEDFVPSFLRTQREKELIAKAKAKKEAEDNAKQEASVDLMSMMVKNFDKLAKYDLEMLSKRLSSGDFDEFVDALYGIMIQKGSVDSKLQRRLDYQLYGEDVVPCIS